MDEILDKKFRNSEAELGIRRIVRCKNIEQWQKMIKYKNKLGRTVR
jgi:aryl carrier-like protein